MCLLMSDVEEEAPRIKSPLLQVLADRTLAMALKLLRLTPDANKATHAWELPL
jgi:hypothetical protein